MTYNIEDVRTADLHRANHPRLQRAAARIQHLAPDILLINEMTYDQPGAPGYEEGTPEGQNAQRFVESYLSTPQTDSLDGTSYQTVMLPVNTGIPSDKVRIGGRCRFRCRWKQDARADSVHTCAYI